MTTPEKLARECAEKICFPETFELGPDQITALILAALTAAKERQKRDGERYQYLRKGCTCWLLSTGQWELTTKHGEFIGPDLDVLVGAAMSKEATP